MTFNPLWKMVENFDNSASPSFSFAGSSARGSYGNYHDVNITPFNPIVTSTLLPVYNSAYYNNGTAVYANPPAGFFGGGDPVYGPDSQSLADWMMANTQIRAVNIHGFNSSPADGLWQDMGYLLFGFNYSGGGTASYTLEIRNKFTGAILFSGTYTLTE